jgi:hypothetical protein
MKKLVLITGTGRSGTSTMSGTLHHLGLFVPGPYLGANKSNPKGFFESKWAIAFHRRITTAARIDFFDGRPSALERAREAVTPELRNELIDFLREQSAEHDQVVVKDPRTVWAHEVWREAAAEAGLEICYISMLRHPAEVVGSRRTYYAKSEDPADIRRYENINVARWVNNSLISEHETRGRTRAFVRYVDLLTDWRQVAQRLGDDLGLRFDVDVTSEDPHEVDEFIDPDLRRHTVTWEDLEVPGDLQEVAETTWSDLGVLSDHHGSDADAEADLDRQSERYDLIVAQAAAISYDLIQEARTDGKREGAAATRKRIAAAKKAAAPAPKPAAPKPPPKPAPRPRPKTVDEMPVGEVGGRDLLKVVAARARKKLRRG